MPPQEPSTSARKIIPPSFNPHFSSFAVSSFFLSLTFPDMQQAVSVGLGVLTEGAHAVELRVDLLSSQEVCLYTEEGGECVHGVLVL